MASTNKIVISPFASAFCSAINRGTPSTVAVQSIARRRRTTPTAVFQSLHRSGMVQRQRFNGKWVYWPVTAKKGKTPNIRTVQTSLFQQIIDWAIASGSITPKQLQNAMGSQQQFVKVGQKFFTTSTGSTRKTRRSASSRRTSKTSSSSKATNSSRTSSATPRTTRTHSMARTRTARGRSSRTVRISSNSQRRIRRAA